VRVILIMFLTGVKIVRRGGAMGGGSNREGLAGAWLPVLDNAFCVSGDVSSIRLTEVIGTAHGCS
jgi:hypothetical protein